MPMDEVAEKVKKEFEETSKKAEDHINSIQEYGKTGVELSSATTKEKSSLPRLNGVAQDNLNLLQSLQFKLDLLAPQLPTDDQRELILGDGRESTIRRRNLQTKAGMTSAAEGITESLRRTRQMMIQVIIQYLALFPAEIILLFS
nr:uncharacterized protein LOC109165532 [Ipomoea trifida]